MSTRASGQVFTPTTQYPSGGSVPFGIVIADVNGDGKPDIITANSAEQGDSCTGCGVGVLLGNGDGTFQPATQYSSGGVYPNSPVVADLNGDGKPDLVVLNICGDFTGNCAVEGSVGVLLGNGDGTFQPVTLYPSGGIRSFAVAVADVNRDGRPDLVVGSSFGLSGSPGVVTVFIGNGDGTFQAPTTYPAGNNAEHMALADVNGDGKVDVIIIAPGRTLDQDDSVVTVLLGNGDGSFQRPAQYDLAGSVNMLPNALVLADVNGDGRADLVGFYACIPCGQNQISVSLGNGDGTFQTPAYYGNGGVGASPAGGVVSDVNGNGKLDILGLSPCTVSGTCNGSLGVLIGNGAGSFQPPVSYQFNELGGGYALAVGDLNGDGKPDVAVGNACLSDCSNGQVRVMINDLSIRITGAPQQPLTKDGQGNFVANITITNSGNVPLSSLQVTIAGTTLGSGSLLAAPPPITNLAPGASAIVTLKFPPNSVKSGSTSAPLKVSGTYSVSSPSLNGNWNLSFRSVSLQ